MRNKKRIVVLIAAVMLLEMVSLTVQSRHLAAAETTNKELETKNSHLRLAIEQTTAYLEYAREQKAQSHPIAPVPAGDKPFIPVSKAALAKAHFSIEDGLHFEGEVINLSLSPFVAELLGLTDSETTQVQNVFSEMQTRLESLERSSLTQVTFEQLPKNCKTDFMDYDPVPGKNYGPPVYYEIDIPEDQRTALHTWMVQALADAIGQDRTDVIMQKAMEEDEYFWLNPGLQVSVAFRRHQPDQNGDTLDFTKSTIDSAGSGSVGGNGSSTEKGPSEWAYFFRAGLIQIPAVNGSTAQPTEASNESSP